MATSDEQYYQLMRERAESQRLSAEFSARIDQANTERNKVSEQAKATLDQINGDTSLTAVQRAQAELDLRNNVLKPANDSVLNAYESILTDMKNSALLGNELVTLLQRTQTNLNTLTDKVKNNNSRISELSTIVGKGDTTADKQKEKDSASSQTAADGVPLSRGSDQTGTNAGSNPDAKPLTKEEIAANKNVPKSGEEDRNTPKRQPAPVTSQPAPTTAVAATQKVDATGTKKKKASTVTSNPLHKYATYTYGITLHLLSAQSYNDMANGKAWLPGAKTLISSAGRYGSKTFKRPAQFADDFYFDGLTMETIIGLTAQGKSSNVINISFNLIEPYGLTLLNRLLEMAVELQIPNYLANPYVLQIDFFGNDEAGDIVHPIPNLTKYVPIKLIDMKMKVGATGTNYACRAIPYNHEAFSQVIASTPANFEITAKTVQDFFQNDADEANLINQAKENDQRKENLNKNSQKLSNESDAESRRLGLKTAGPQAGEKEALAKPYDVKSYNGAYNAYQQYLVDNKSIEHPTKIKFDIDPEISKSSIVYEKKNSSANTAMTNTDNSKEVSKAVAANNTGGGRNSATASGMDLTKEKFNVNAGTSILDVINLVMRNSTYITDQIKDKDKVDSDGNPMKWFKVIPHILLKDFDFVKNQYSHEVTFKIIAYTAHNGKHPLAPISTDEQIQRGLRKEYNYIYTGHNSDIIDFAIDFDALYFNAVNVFSKNLESLSDAQDADAQPGGFYGKSSFNPLPKQRTDTVQPTQTQITTGDQRNVGMNSGQNSSIQIAADVMQSLYSTPRGEMLNAKLKIIGDPDFIKQDDVYHSPGNADYPDMEATRTPGGSILTDRGDIFARISFKTPVDMDTATGGLRTDQKYLNSNFSGIYKIIKVSSEFRGGRFEQNLETIRYPDPAVDPNKAKAVSERTDTQDKNKLNDKPVAKAEAPTKKLEQPVMSPSEVAKAKLNAVDNKEVSKLAAVADNGETKNLTEVQGAASTAKDSTADATAAAPPAPPPPAPPVPPAPPTLIEETFAGASLSAYNNYGRVVVQIVLPSGKKVYASTSWGETQWRSLLNSATGADIDALSSLSASWDTLTAQYKAKLLPNG